MLIFDLINSLEAILNPSHTVSRFANMESPPLESFRDMKFKPEKSLSRFHKGEDLQIRVNTKRTKKKRKMSKENPEGKFYFKYF